MEGLGSLFNERNELIFEGEWANDHYHGRGIEYNNNKEISDEIEYKDMSTIGNKWEKYEGQFINGYRHGTGMIYFTNGERYFGGIDMDKVNGAGTFKNK